MGRVGWDAISGFKNHHSVALRKIIVLPWGVAQLLFPMVKLGDKQPLTLRMTPCALYGAGCIALCALHGALFFVPCAVHCILLCTCFVSRLGWGRGGRGCRVLEEHLFGISPHIHFSGQRKGRCVIRTITHRPFRSHETPNTLNV